MGKGEGGGDFSYDMFLDLWIEMGKQSRVALILFWETRENEGTRGGCVLFDLWKNSTHVFFEIGRSLETSSNPFCSFVGGGTFGSKHNKELFFLFPGTFGSK